VNDARRLEIRRTRSPRTLPLLVCAAMLVAAPGSAERIDLTAYLAPQPASGDYRTYVTQTQSGEFQERYDVKAISPAGPGWRVDWEGEYDELVRPGARIRRATSEDSPPPGCRSAVAYGLRNCVLRLKLGRQRAFQFGGVGFEDFPFAYVWRVRGSYTAEGFEPLETPYASHASALKLTAVVRHYRGRATVVGFEVVDRGPLHLDFVETRESWYVEGVGIVAARVAPGLPGEAAAPTEEMWLMDGLVQGLPYP
jgi:hypothetical protein